MHRAFIQKLNNLQRPTYRIMNETQTMSVFKKKKQKKKLVLIIIYIIGFTNGNYAPAVSI